MMQCEAERVITYEDIATTLALDPITGFKRRKLSTSDLPPLDEESTQEFLDILENIKEDRNTKRALDQLLSTKWGKEATSSMSGAQRAELERHILTYLETLTDEAGFKLEREDRYQMENFQGVKVVATRGWEKGEHILVGTTIKIGWDQEVEMTQRGVDSSCMLRSARTKDTLVLLGPITMTNHSCEANCEFHSSEKTVVLRATKDIQAGDELTSNYGRDYFREENKDCQCPDCEKKKKGYYRKLQSGERRDRDLFTPRDDNAILKVCIVYWCLVYSPHMCVCSVSLSQLHFHTNFVSVLQEEWRLLPSQWNPALGRDG